MVSTVMEPVHPAVWVNQTAELELGPQAMPLASKGPQLSQAVMVPALTGMAVSQESLPRDSRART